MIEVYPPVHRGVYNSGIQRVFAGNSDIFPFDMFHLDYITKQGLVDWKSGDGVIALEIGQIVNTGVLPCLWSERASAHATGFDCARHNIVRHICIHANMAALCPDMNEISISDASLCGVLGVNRNCWDWFLSRKCRDTSMKCVEIHIRAGAGVEDKRETSGQLRLGKRTLSRFNVHRQWIIPVFLKDRGCYFEFPGRRFKT